MGLTTTGTPAQTGKGTFEMSFDLHFSRIGQPITPAITAPPTRYLRPAHQGTHNAG